MGADPGQAFARRLPGSGHQRRRRPPRRTVPDLDDPEFGGPIRELRDMARRWEANPLPAATIASPLPEHGTRSDPEKHKVAAPTRRPLPIVRVQSMNAARQQITLDIAGRALAWPTTSSRR